MATRGPQTGVFKGAPVSSVLLYDQRLRSYKGKYSKFGVTFWVRSRILQGLWSLNSWIQGLQVQVCQRYDGPLSYS